MAPHHFIVLLFLDSISNSSSRVYLARNNSHSIIFRVRTMRVNSDATLHIYDLPAINQQLLMGCAHFIVVLFFILL